MNARNPVCSAILCLLTCAVSENAAAEPPGSRRWEQEIQAFEAADRVTPPSQGAILFVGSSTIRLWKTLAHDFPEHNIINRGFGGCQIADCTCYADRIVIPYKPRLIVLRAGVNDIDAFDATMGADGKPREDLFVKDRLHFNAEGYKILAPVVRSHLK